MKYTARQPVTNVNVTPASPLREFFVLAGGVLGIAIALYLLLGLALDLFIPHIPIHLEKRMAGLFMDSMGTGEADLEAEKSVQALLEKLKGVRANPPYPFKVHVLKGATVNALALPGGRIIVFTGLLETVASENELAFVLAHELGHYAHRDHLRGLGRSLIFAITFALLPGSDSGVGKMLAQGLNITEMSFSRKGETLADEFALETLYRVYGHVAGATDFFQTIGEENDPGRFGHYFASHPENRKRITHLEELTRLREYPLGVRQPLLE